MMGRWPMPIAAWTFVSIVWLFSNSFARAEPSTIVNIKNGTLEGAIMTSRKGKEFVSFRGIPYAQPPLDELRFEPPKPFDSWSGVRSATQDANICTQRDVFTNQEEVVGVEDCLYLNVYTPKLSLNEIDADRINYPVMIWFHGGGWMSGAGHSEFYGPKFLLDHDVVLVTVNFRLGPLGFLSTEDHVSPGNQGLKDQAQSIRWVNENIAAFGGDPNRVTLFGQSAGGASVQYHMMSPLSKGLFHRGISQSGTAISPWALHKPGKARKQANKLGQLLDCPTDTSVVLVECLKKKDAIDIIATDHAFMEFGYLPIIPFRPVVEDDRPGAFLIEDPVQSLKSGKMADIPWMTGLTSDEGAIIVSNFYGLKDKDYVQLLDKKFMELAPMSLMYEVPEKSKDDVTKKIREFYFGKKNIDESTRMSLVDLYTDPLNYIPVDESVRGQLQTSSSPVYYYFFAYRGSSSFTKIFGDSERDYGVSHGDDLLYLFPISEIKFPDTPMNTEDENVIDLMTKLWTNFAKSGNPTPMKTPEVSVKWKPVRTSNLEYLHIGNSKNLQMSANLWSDRVKFWASIPHRSNIELTLDDHHARDEL